MHLDSRSTEQLHIDQAVARACLFARLLNETLDELRGYGVDCLSVDDPAYRSHDRCSLGDRRVELVLMFKARPANARTP